MRAESCFLCGGLDWREIGVSSEHGSLVRCGGCGLVALSAPRAVGDVNLAHYTEGRAGAFPEDLEAQFRRWAEFRLDQLLGIQPTARRVAEVGCGTGHFLRAASDRGLSAKGFDLADCRTCGQSAEFETASEPFSRLGSAKWDAVAAFHVLEHCPEPASAVGAIVRSLRPNGTGFVEVPGIVEKALPPALLINPHHQWYFTEKTLRRLVEKCGGKVLKVERVGPTALELRTMAVAGQTVSRRWNAFKRTMPGFMVGAARLLLRPHRERLTRALAPAMEPAQPEENLPLNLCIFFTAG